MISDSNDTIGFSMLYKHLAALDSSSITVSEIPANNLIHTYIISKVVGFYSKRDALYSLWTEFVWHQPKELSLQIKLQTINYRNLKDFGWNLKYSNITMVLQISNINRIFCGLAIIVLLAAYHTNTVDGRVITKRQTEHLPASTSLAETTNMLKRAGMSAADLRNFCGQVCSQGLGGSVCNCNVRHFVGKRVPGHVIGGGLMNQNSISAFNSYLSSNNQSRSTLQNILNKLYSNRNSQKLRNDTHPAGTTPASTNSI